MLCERCKIREANIQYTEIINGVKKVNNFCTQCAKEMDFGQYSAIFDGDFPLAKLLSGLLGEESSEEKDDFKNIVCPTCHTSYEEFVKDSRFGCPDCYEVFDLLINDNIKQLQGSDTHKGKHPQYRTKMVPDSIHLELTKSVETNKHNDVTIKVEDIEQQKQLTDLKNKLEDAIASEEFELAADYRDKIKNIKIGGDTDA